MNRFTPLVKNQIGWFNSQINRFPPGHPRHRPEQIALYQRLIREHEELLAFLESVPEERSPASLPVAKPVAQDLSDLPPELLNELSGSTVNGDSDPLVDIIEERGGTATLDEILIDMYRKRGEVNKRNLLTNRLYRLSKRGLIWLAPGRKGVYSTRPPEPETQPPASEAVVSLFERQHS